MKKLLFICLLTSTFFAHSQETVTEIVYSPDVINPTFNGGGLDEFYKFINKEFDYSKVTKPGKMLVSFNINKLGEVTNIKVLEFNDIESATEIIRVMNLSPKWESAKRAGSPFGVEIKLPLVFKTTL